jgi:hypothetical protein
VGGAGALLRMPERESMADVEITSR